MIIHGEYVGDEPDEVSVRSTIKGVNAASGSIARSLGFNETFAERMLVMRNSESFTVLVKGNEDEVERLGALLKARPHIQASVSRSDAELIDDQSTARSKNEFLNMLNAPLKKK